MKLKQLLILLIPVLVIVSCSEDITGPKTSFQIEHQTINSLHYLSIGASDTKAMGASDTTTLGYTHLIQKELREFVINLDTTNVGVSGHTIDQINQVQKDATVRAQPDLITIWTGGNDVKTMMFGQDMDTLFFRDQLDTLLATLTTELPNANIVIGTLPDMTKLPVFTTFFANREADGLAFLSSVNQSIVLKANQYNLTVVRLDQTDLADDPDNISSDGFHPSDAGYALMAKYYMEAIHQLYPYEAVTD